MLRAVLVGLISALTAVSLPVLLLSPMEETERDDRLLIVETIKTEKGSPVTVRLETEQGVQELPLEEYLVGVLVCEMPLSFHEEALKAQVVAARTFALEQMAGGKHPDHALCADSSCCQAWCGSQQLREKLGERFEACLDTAARAVEETAGEALYYQGELIDAVYFSCSGGTTEAAVAVWGSKTPYLQSVESPGEEKAPRFSTTVSYTPEELAGLLGRTDLTSDPAGWLGPLERSEGGGVTTLVIGGRTYAGTALRTQLGLASTLFSVELKDGAFVFSVRGFGHRVGMSQYGANAMAQSGSSYREILAHYYPGTEVKNAASGECTN